jgi:pimeloyl-ACP methyl ester carboxylesterase
VPNKYFQIDGIATFVHHTGATTLPETPPKTDRGEAILCLHGAGGHGGLFADVLASLGDRHSLIAFDQPGHGRSGQLDSLGSIDRMVDFTNAFSDKLGLPPLVLLGHGMGAAIAMRIALANPERVKALVLCGIGASTPVTGEALTHARLVSEGKARRAFDPKIFCPKTEPAVMRRTFMEGMKTDPRATYADLIAFNEWDDAARLALIECPTLILHGEHEFDAIKTGAESLDAALPASRRIALPNAGHALLFEAGSALADAVDAFLNDLPDNQEGAQ